MGRVAAVTFLVFVFACGAHARAESTQTAGTSDKACEIVDSEQGCQPIPRCKIRWSEARCGWAEYNAVSPTKYAQDKTDMVRVIGSGDYGNLHLFVEFTRGPEGLVVMRLINVYDPALAVTVPISEADWRDVLSHVEKYLVAEARQHIAMIKEKRLREERGRRTGMVETVVCTDGINASLERIDSGAISYHSLESCENPPVDDFADYIEAKAYSLVPGCTALRNEAVGYCLGLSGDVFAAAQIANGLPDLFDIDCDKIGAGRNVRGTHFGDDSRLNIAGSEENGQSPSARWEKVVCSQPRWDIYPLNVFAQGDSGLVTGTVHYENWIGVCPAKTEMRNYSRLFRQRWKRDVRGIFRVTDWDIGSEALISTGPVVCGMLTSTPH